MNRIQVAGYVSPRQKYKLVKLAELDGLSLSGIISALIDESFALNFPEEANSETETAEYEAYRDNL